MSEFSAQDQQWMQQAFALAQTAAVAGEVPVGAVLVANNTLVSSAHNGPIRSCDPTAHAEVVALRQGAKALNNYRLIDTTLYVTLEPCLMCIGAIVHARVQRLVFGAYDLRAGAVTSAFQMLDTEKLNHKVEYAGGLLAEPCAQLLSDFFKAKR